MYFALMGKLDARRKGLLDDKEKGFTLIELLVVVIIIGILAAIAIPVYIGVQNNAKDSAVKSDLANIKTAQVAYYTTNNAYTTDLTKLTDSGYKSASIDYTKGGTAPTVKLTGSGNTAGFCVAAVSPTGTKAKVTDADGVSTGDTATC